MKPRSDGGAYGGRKDMIVTNWSIATTCDTQRFGSFFRTMLEQGVYLTPSQFEAGFMSLAHSEEEVNATVAAARQAFHHITRYATPNS